MDSAEIYSNNREKDEQTISWDEAYERLKKGECIAYPTDTVWGLGCIADDPERVRACLALKGELRHPVASVILPLSRIGAPYVRIEEGARFAHVLPGAYTFIFPTPDECPLTHIAGEGPSLGVRVPRLPELNHMVEKLDAPLLTTSLNFHNEPPCTSLEQARVIAERMGISCVQVATECAGVSSSVVKWTNGDWEVLRYGSGSIAALKGESDDQMADQDMRERKRNTKTSCEREAAATTTDVNDVIEVAARA